ncbi:aldo/keto reductase [Salsuginibacillus kocurii]|uniref:aldo/keto reductase n=1 Tax=Salsuginibacillus kocurii TaxID=427078 RepID=UPI0006866A1B|nr:aldo/keto reductase [Salsuginibacillus kocurii]
MPQLGLGVYKAEEGNEVEEAVQAAIESGYRSIDTASFYGNEKGVGKAIEASGLPRKDVFLTTKLWNDDHGYEQTLKAFEKSRLQLSVDYIDLYLLHWPVPNKFEESWKALEKLYQEGFVRAIGVSNFHQSHLEQLSQTMQIKPMVNQVEFHPLLFQEELLEYCRMRDIQLQSWRPLTRGHLLEEPIIRKLAEKYEKTPAQIVLRWHIEQGVATIPKSVTPARIHSNADIFDFRLESEDIIAINQLNQGQRFGPHPDTFDYNG